MKLTYIRNIGEVWNGKVMYEFIFSKKIEGVDGEDWDTVPASNGNPEPPGKGYIDKVGRFETDEFTLVLIQNDEKFAVWDAVDGVVALAWENIDGYDEYPDDRVKFFYGDDLSEVTDLLYSRDIIIEWKYDSKDELQE